MKPPLVNGRYSFSKSSFSNGVGFLRTSYFYTLGFPIFIRGIDYIIISFVIRDALRFHPISKSDVPKALIRSTRFVQKMHLLSLVPSRY